MTPDDIATFWFGDPNPGAPPSPDAIGRWFGGGPAFDDDIRARFGGTLALGAPDVEAWAGAPAGALAALVVLDQLPRNAFRGTARAFWTDARARALANDTIARGLDAAVHPARRIFFYLPFEHAEDLAAQDRAVALFEQLAAEAPELASYVRYAVAHRDVIARFGRFPGRNASLGREDTPDEAEWRAAGGASWGQ